ncbi:MAG: hypothetical protein U9R21_06215 [Candidatus Thermoplasmatota archaeon]|nr:hypothetical protein [Candidatus Thermoplasmatota archaeon]
MNGTKEGDMTNMEASTKFMRMFGGQGRKPLIRPAGIKLILQGQKIFLARKTRQNIGILPCFGRYIR